MWLFQFDPDGLALGGELHGGCVGAAVDDLRGDRVLDVLLDRAAQISRPVGRAVALLDRVYVYPHRRTRN